MKRELLIVITLAVATLIFASFTAILLTRPEPAVAWHYEGVYGDSLLFQNGKAWMAYDVYTHETVSADSYRGIIDVVKNK